jgi:hypothetical protein
MSTGKYSVGGLPPQVLWTIVRGDFSSFKVYVTDDSRIALDLSTWTIDLDIRRGESLILALVPAPTADDNPGYFTVKLLPGQSEILQSDDIFDIQLFDGDEIVWTVAQGEIVILEGVTDAPG